jgi:hypothetical protein
METPKPIGTIQAVLVNDEPIPVALSDTPVATTIVNEKALPVVVTNAPPQYEYKVSQIWTGWWGGWGSNGNLNNRLNEQAIDGWRLVDSRSSIRLWWWFYPRPKVLLFFERERRK